MDQILLERVDTPRLSRENVVVLATGGFALLYLALLNYNNKLNSILTSFIKLNIYHHLCTLNNFKETALLFVRLIALVFPRAPRELFSPTTPNGAPNDSFLLKTLKTLFRLSKILLDL